ncbi:MAG TPA: hypothetical protein VN153_11320, partial [Tahibacter sp.]|nr:hypothetical protein [Tahibacter sp.]
GPPPSLESLAVSVTTNVNCGMPWLSASPNAGTLGVGGSDTAVVTADASALALGTYRGFVCVDSNGTDADEPKTAVLFSLDVNDRIFASGFEATP